MAVAVGLTGCRAAGTGSLSLLPRHNPAATSFDLDEFVAEHNRNAEAIESLEARPSINVAMRRVMRFTVDGRMALERPRNFKLELQDHGNPKADIGSNAEEFWYWVVNEDKEQKWIYWCDYRDRETAELPVTYQPDWIIEAMGLRPITPQEAATAQVRRGLEAGTTVLTFPAARDRGESNVREMIVSNSDRRLKKLRIFSEASRDLIAEAQPGDYQAYNTGATGSTSGESCYLPQKLKLDWKREQLVLDVALNQVKVNQFDHAMGADIFVEPQMPGYTRLNLAERSRSARPDRRTRTRQTMPPPDSRNDIDLGRPAPISDEEPIVPKVGRRTSPTALEEDGPPLTTLNELVGAPVSRPPNPVPLQSSSFPGSPGRDLTIER
jgi:hypothetical protein